MKLSPQIEEIDYGIAYCVTDGNRKWIQVNKNLKHYPKLYKSTLQHEMEHFNSSNNNLDFMIDLKNSFSIKNSWDAIKFMLHYPKSFFAISPVFYEKRKWSFNWFMIIMNVALISVIIGGIILL